MEWKYATQPDPETSVLWSDDFWPPEEWCFLPETAVTKLDSLWTWNDPPTTKNLVAKITEEQFMLWAVHNIVGSICGGGFDSALDHNSGELAEEGIIGLRKFGFFRHAEIIDEAWDAFGIRPIPRNGEERYKQYVRMNFVDSLPPIWSKLQDELYGLLHAKTHGEGYNAAFFRPLAEWVNGHRDRFFIT